jgi:hypothetical protein
MLSSNGWDIDICFHEKDWGGRGPWDLLHFFFMEQSLEGSSTHELKRNFLRYKLIARVSIIEKKRTSASGTLKPTWKGSFQKWHPSGLSLPWNLFISAVWHDLRLPFTNCPRWLTNHAPVCLDASCTIHTPRPGR